jgi:hypothetical protein
MQLEAEPFKAADFVQRIMRDFSAGDGDVDWSKLAVVASEFVVMAPSTSFM